MAELFGIVGSAVGVISLGLTACNGLIKYYSSYKDSKGSVSKIVTSLEGLVATMEQLEDLRLAECFPPEQVHNVNARVLDCKDSMDELDEELKKFNMYNLTPEVGSHRAGLRDALREQRGRLLYPFRESTLMKLKESVNDITENLNLAIQSLHLSSVPMIKEKLDSISDSLNGVSELVIDHEAGKRNAILEWFSAIDCHTKQAEILARHEKQTGRWLLETREFEHWMGEKGGVLWGTGGPGVGKTVLSSVVINHIQEKTRGTDSAVAFVYCTYAERNSQRLGQILGSLIQQLLQHPRNATLPFKVSKLYLKYTKTKTRPLDHDLEVLLRYLISYFKEVHIIIDALDECDESTSTTRRLIHTLGKLDSRVRIFYTSRYTGEGRDEQMPVGARRIKISGREEDIRKYLWSQIQTESNLMRLCEQQKGLADMIIDEISLRADGMFLLAHFHIRFLATKLRVKHLLSALRILPGQLDVLYHETLKRIRKGQDTDKANLAMRVLQWIVFTSRPLNIQELRHALSAMELDDEDNTFDMNDLYPVDLLINICCGLVFIDESNTVRLVHHSVQEYLMKRRHALAPHGEAEIRKSCARYLSMVSALDFEPEDEAGDLQKEETRFSQVLQQLPLLHYSCKLWMDLLNPINQRPSIQPNEILDFISQQDSRSFALVICDALFFPKENRLLEMVTQSRRIEKALKIANCFSFNPLARNLPTLLKTAIFDLPMLTELVLNDGANVDETSHRGLTALHAAAFNGSRGVLECLLARNARVDQLCDSNWGCGWTALHLASTQDSHVVIKKLIQVNSTNTKDSVGRTPLLVAARWSYYGIAFLHETKDYLRVVADLAINSANIHAKDSNGHNALSWPTATIIENHLLNMGVTRTDHDQSSCIIGYPIFLDLYIEYALLTLNQNTQLPADDEALTLWLSDLSELAEYPCVPRSQRYLNLAQFRDTIFLVPSSLFPGFPKALQQAIPKEELPGASEMDTTVISYTFLLKSNGKAILFKQPNIEPPIPS